MKIKVLQQNLINNISNPSRGSKYSAGVDIYSPYFYLIKAGKTKKIVLGIAIEVNNNEVAIMSERSSQSKNGITSIGNIIDADYRGEISIVLQNNSNQDYTINQNDKIGQIIIVKLGDNSIKFVNELSETKRGAGGFGSTGK